MGDELRFSTWTVPSLQPCCQTARWILCTWTPGMISLELSMTSRPGGRRSRRVASSQGTTSSRVSSPKATSSGYQGCRRCFLERWHGRHLRLVDKWGAGDAEADPADLASHLFYVDIANIHGKEIRSQHRVHCEARLADALRTGRAEIFNLDSAVAAAMLPDSS